ncbi:class I SAM-dependent methyltransferase [Actinotalea sp. M2MS4P-6]|uniref:class I SAM-dependent methyltransferase n=1 Tax=Actinotalea sp. M2MS4P-6 TaxID=2983762 RepID=UPI0021E398EA|nr:class I SAM-dependent methyltransferase [Actinotalea sp. M2MS4P-6]MCV2395304.1 class I SAM-dependent methyltransferase [Actinotalea sp. M2MS4P-6]
MSHDHSSHDHSSHPPTHPQTAADWDRRYAESDRVWSGRPNATLVAEAGGLAPGRALDVGCGEGADAVWLAARGWRVTATDISRVAVERAERAGAEHGVEVEWLVADITDGPPRAEAYDLVVTHYPALSHDHDDAAARAVLAAVAPGGTLLFVGHALEDGRPVAVGGQDPAERVQPSDVAALLDDGWQVEVLESRPHADGEHARHPHDSVLRARRTAR